MVAAITSGTSYNVVRYRLAPLEGIRTEPTDIVQYYREIECRVRYTLRPLDSQGSDHLWLTQNASDERLAGPSQRASSNFPGLVAGGPGSTLELHSQRLLQKYTSTHLGAVRHTKLETIERLHHALFMF